MTKNNREAQNFVGMSDTMKHYELEKLVDIICSVRKGSMDDKQHRATVEHNLRTAYTVGLESERERIRKGVDSLPYREKGEIIGGLFTDERMRGPNVEQIETINRFAVHKVIDNTIDDYDLISNKGRDK